ncbi:hypothetical protein G7046_g3016 [Stylonectria norvegica]|nr:hypothetical protein G7046_g3016 [Stylonectria norvegica]
MHPVTMLLSLAASNVANPGNEPLKQMPQLMQRGVGLTCEQVGGEGWVQCGENTLQCYNEALRKTCCKVESDSCQAADSCAPIAGLSFREGEDIGVCGTEVVKDAVENDAVGDNLGLTTVKLLTTITTTVSLATVGITPGYSTTSIQTTAANPASSTGPATTNMPANTVAPNIPASSNTNDIEVPDIPSRATKQVATSSLTLALVMAVLATWMSA